MPQQPVSEDYLGDFCAAVNQAAAAILEDANAVNEIFSEGIEQTIKDIRSAAEKETDEKARRWLLDFAQRIEDAGKAAS